MTYDWLAGLVLLAALYLMVRLGYFLVFKVPVLQRTREFNREQDAIKMATQKYPPMVKASLKVGLWTNVAFFLVLAPLVVTLEARPVWRCLVDVVLILAVFDFFYYLAHRFLLHGVPYFKRVHAVHHQVHDPTYIDGLYVHPLETFIGQSLFIGSAFGLGALFGPFHVGSVAAAYMFYVQLNSLNHVHVDLPYFPYKYLDYFTTKHAIHHIDMSKGNFSTITMLYDYALGTLD
ncbi:MAG: sterol desaturase family protein [Deltaproteobacteria bacterium]|nr:sterol desaturase family protein [Deltaproteobacteria bacterium]MBW2361229.1 sterol desaturase family protein [Deltaproteobacteria bacterium]